MRELFTLKIPLNHALLLKTDAQSICHNRHQLMPPHENHRTFVFPYNWICAAGLRQPHDPASCLWLLQVTNLQCSAQGNPQQRRDAPKSSATSSFLTTLHRGPELLSRARWRSVHPPLANYQGGYPSPLCGIWVFTLLLPGFPALDVTKRNLKTVFLQSEMPHSEKLISWLFIPQFVKAFVLF